MAAPCFGSTTALRLGDLRAIGGFKAFSNVLADDYAIGAALRAKGLEVAIPSFLVGHSCGETSFAELWQHEVRWARTIRTVDPWGHLGSAITHPFAFALLAAAIGAPAPGLALAFLAIVCRVVLLHITARNHDLPSPDYWLVPFRDLLAFVTFAWSFCGHDLTWRGERYHELRDGALVADLRTDA
jgi:ceramide glucosyltransferase